MLHYIILLIAGAFLVLGILYLAIVRHKYRTLSLKKLEEGYEYQLLKVVKKEFILLRASGIISYALGMIILIALCLIKLSPLF